MDAITERPSDRELVVTRTINGPARIVWAAWTDPELFRQWWVPKSFPITLVGVELDVRVGGGYKLTFAAGDGTVDYFGRYLEITPPSRLVWTNDESENEQVTTLTLVESDGVTTVTVHDLYPSKEALDAEIASGSTAGMPEQLANLDVLVADLAATDAA